MYWTDLLRFIAALVFVLSLMGGLAFFLKKMGLSNGTALSGGKRRLKIIETLPIDHRRKILLIQRDEAQHLILLGPNSESVIETGIETSHDTKNETNHET